MHPARSQPHGDDTARRPSTIIVRRAVASGYITRPGALTGDDEIAACVLPANRASARQCQSRVSCPREVGMRTHAAHVHVRTHVR